MQPVYFESILMIYFFNTFKTSRMTFITIRLFMYYNSAAKLSIKSAAFPTIFCCELCFRLVE
ncbi:MAG: hypothetical protein K0S04_2993 [Herbinix sp.]|nr:hypothetical protein [Herbinix sp.]